MTQKNRRPYQLKNEELRGLVSDLVTRAETVLGESEDPELVRQILTTSIRFMRDRIPRGDLRLVNNALKELRHALYIFGDYAHCGRLDGDHRRGRRHHGRGAGRCGPREELRREHLRLPFEQSANPTIAGDRKLINFRYFFTRKVMFVKESHAIALFPGGFGTHDEGYEALTLIQTGKSEILPVVYVDAPGGSYWKDWDEYVRTHLHARGLIGDDDLSLYRVTDSVDEAVDEITNFYSNYHSSRYVRDLLVLRVRKAPDPEQLEQLNDDFSSLLSEGRIEVRRALPEEEGDVSHFPRVTLQFNRRDIGRLRQMIDRLNSYVSEHAAPPIEASPHLIMEQEISEAAEDAELEE
ncbi:MAG: LOG family protein [Planctomycetota bacterium]|jgi:hypothetical protein